jgi:hypothetical protein
MAGYTMYNQGNFIMDILTPLTQYLPSAHSPDQSPYECQSCCTRFDSQRQVCPACGGYTIERIHWPWLDQ